MKKLEIHEMEVWRGGGILKCAAGGIGGYLVGFVGGLEGGATLASAAVITAFPPSAIVVGAAIIGGVLVGLAGAAIACR